MKISERIDNEQNILLFCKQCKYLKLDKPSGIEIEIPIYKRLAINLVKGMAKRSHLGSARISIKATKLIFHQKANDDISSLVYPKKTGAWKGKPKRFFVDPKSVDIAIGTKII